MFVRVKKSQSRKTAVQLVEGYRDPVTNRVKQRVVRHIGYAADDEAILRLRELAEHIKQEIIEEFQPSLFAPEIKLPQAQSQDSPQDYAVDDMRNLRSKQQIMTGVHDVFGMQFDRLGFDRVLANPARKLHSQKILRDIVMARIANPDSKRGSVRFLQEQCGIGLNLDSVYKAMDYLDEQAIEKIQNNTLCAAQKLFPEKLDVLFYDATSLYFESFTQDELRSKGFSKDHKFQEVQILLSIFVTQSGIPVGYEVFPGSTYEGHTLLTALSKLKQRFSIDKVVFVADSGMLQKANLDLLEEHGYQYIVGARIKNMSADITEKILSSEGFSQLYCSDDPQKGKIIELKDGKKLVITHSEKRARKDAHDRQQALEKLAKQLSKSDSLKSAMSNNGSKKYLSITGKSQMQIDQDKVANAEKWDGLHGLITNMQDVDMAEIAQHYRGLWQVEETFRVTKHDLKIRPIYHWTPGRIRAHIALCFMALVCVRHVEHRMMLANKKMSPERIRKALSNVGITTVQHVVDKRTFAIPLPACDDAKAIYKTHGLKLPCTPYLIK